MFYRRLIADDEFLGYSQLSAVGYNKRLALAGRQLKGPHAVCKTVGIIIVLTFSTVRYRGRIGKRNHISGVTAYGIGHRDGPRLASIGESDFVIIIGNTGNCRFQAGHGCIAIDRIAGVINCPFRGANGFLDLGLLYLKLRPLGNGQGDGLEGFILIEGERDLRLSVFVGGDILRRILRDFIHGIACRRVAIRTGEGDSEGKRLGFRDLACQCLTQLDARRSAHVGERNIRPIVRHSEGEDVGVDRIFIRNILALAL